MDTQYVRIGEVLAETSTCAKIIAKALKEQGFEIVAQANSSEYFDILIKMDELMMWEEWED